MNVQALDVHGFYADDPLIPRTSRSAGIDLRACIGHAVLVVPGEVRQVSFGLKLWLETDTPHVGLIAVRSSCARRGLSLVNGVGIVDQDFRGELCGLFTSISEPYTLVPGTRVAQIVFVPRIGIEGAPALRGEGGFGSTDD